MYIKQVFISRNDANLIILPIPILDVFRSITGYVPIGICTEIVLVIRFATKYSPATYILTTIGLSPVPSPRQNQNEIILGVR
jgi:hypothetical protein